MMSLTFGLFTQVSGSGPLGPLVSIYSSGGHFVQCSGTIWANLVEGKPRNISVKLLQNLSTDLAEEVVKSLFLFIALAVILFNVAVLFEQFW